MRSGGVRACACACACVRVRTRGAMVREASGTCLQLGRLFESLRGNTFTTTCRGPPLGPPCPPTGHEEG